MKHCVRVLLSVLCSLFLAGEASAQSDNFGKNNIQYATFRWQYVKTENFFIYYYKGGENLARFASVHAEESYRSAREMTNYTIDGRSILIIYNSLPDFLQSNILPQSTSFGEGGVTQIYKNKLTLFFDGSYENFNRSIIREITHTFLNEMFHGGGLRDILQNVLYMDVPEWFSDGLAEYLASGWDADADNFMRDAIRNNTIKQIGEIKGLYSTKAGQSVWYFIAETYGKEKISEILYMTRLARNISYGFMSVLGLNIKTLSERWLSFYEDKYKAEEKNNYDKPEDKFSFLTSVNKKAPSYIAEPLISPNKKNWVYASNSGGVYKIILRDFDRPDFEKVIYKGGTKSESKAAAGFIPAMAWFPAGEQVLAAVERKGHIELVAIDISNGEKRWLGRTALTSVSSLDFSPDGQRILICGAVNGQPDVFIYNLGSGFLQSVTNDFYDDAYASWGADGYSFYFSSNRTSDTIRTEVKRRLSAYDNYGIFCYSFTADNPNILQRVTDTPLDNEFYPRVMSDGKLLYLTDETGIYNLKIWNPSDSSSGFLTHSLAGISQYSVLSAPDKILFSIFYKGVFRIAEQDSFNFSMENSFPVPNTPFKQSLITAYEKAHPKKITPVDSLMQKGISDTLHIENPERKDSTGTDEKKSGIDYNNYVFDNEKGIYKKIEKKKKSNITVEEKKINSTHLYEEADLSRAKIYKLTFSAEQIAIQPRWDPFFGFFVLGQFRAQDLFNNHRMEAGGTASIPDFKNIDYFVRYSYLEKRLDYTIQLQKTARYLSSEDYIYHNHALDTRFAIAYPLSRFARAELTGIYNYFLRQNIQDIPDEDLTSSLAGGSLALVYDNTKLKSLNILRGLCYRTDYLFLAGIQKNNLQFGTFSGDVRYYKPVLKESIIALRLSGAVSMGVNKQKFFLGGVDNWLNFSKDKFLNPEQYPVEEDISDYYYIRYVTPMRGFFYNVRNGNKYAMINAELRIPFMHYLMRGYVAAPGFYNTQIVGFFDAGMAWETGNPFADFTPQGTIVNASVPNVIVEYNTFRTSLVYGTGFGIHTIFAGFFTKIDLSWGIEDGYFSEPRYFISLGYDF